MGMPNEYAVFVYLLCIYRKYVVEGIGLEDIKPMDPRIPQGPRIISSYVM